MHNIILNVCMMKVLLGMNEVFYVALLMYDVNVNACSILVGLLSMCEFMDFTRTLHKWV